MRSSRLLSPRERERDFSIRASIQKNLNFGIEKTKQKEVGHWKKKQANTNPTSLRPPSLPPTLSFQLDISRMYFINYVFYQTYKEPMENVASISLKDFLY